MPRSIRPAFAGVIFLPPVHPSRLVTLPPTRAKFVRITADRARPMPPPWSIRNLRIHEAPAASAKK